MSLFDPILPVGHEAAELERSFVRRLALKSLADAGKRPDDLNPITRAEWEAKIAAIEVRYYVEKLGAARWRRLRRKR